MILELVKNLERFKINVVPTTDAGKSDNLWNKPVNWILSDNSIASLQINPDTMSAWFIPISPGTVKITISSGSLSRTMEIIIAFITSISVEQIR